MSVLVYIDSIGGVAKNAKEAVYYGSKVANGNVTVVTAGDASNDELAKLGNYGASKVIKYVGDLDSQQATKLITETANSLNAEYVIFSQDLTGKAVSPRVAIRLNAGLVSGAIALPEGDGTVRTNSFSGKAISYVKFNTDKKVISILPNSLAPVSGDGIAEVVDSTVDVGTAKVTVTEKAKVSGDRAPLPEAELVVSAGRGLKGPENWGIVEDLANVLGATTACSRPVADSHWRPHHEHVGQTGVAIRPNLYIAIGISGAIQHLAGVNGSKVIVVINIDPEAPFFKAADYGIIGDAFEVLPKLTEAVKKFKSVLA